MSDIVINTYNLKQYAQRMGNVNSRITKLDWRLKTLYSQVGLQGLLSLIQADAMTCYSWRLLRCQSYLNQTATDFEKTENYISQFDPANFRLPSPTDVWLDFVRSNSSTWNSHLRNIQRTFRNRYSLGLVGFGAVESALWLMHTDAWTAFWGGDLSYSYDGSVWSTESEDGESFFKVLTSESSGLIEPEYAEYKNKKLKKISKQDSIDVPWQKDNLPDEDWYEKTGTILEVKEEIKAEGSVLEGRLAGDNGWAEGSVDVKVLTGEAHASASGGLYVYEADKNGNIKRILSPGVSAEVGASVAVFQVEAEGRIGLGEDKNMLGLYGDVDAKVLSAEAKAEASVNRNEVFLGASAEADLAKVSASGGIAVLGTDIGINGSLKVGIGAHAEVGYTDGKFKVDIGAAVGVGFDLGFEVDVSGTVDAVCDFASSAWEGVSNTVSDAWNGVNDTVSGAWNWLFG